MKYIFALACLLSIVGCVQTVVKEPVSISNAARAKDLQEKTVALVKTHTDGSLSIFCAGVWIRTDLILTAGHCVQHGTEPVGWPDNIEWDPVGSGVKYTTFDIQEGAFDGMVLSFDKAHDLGLVIASNPPTHKTVEMELGSIDKGERVFIMGHPNGQPWVFTSGDVSDIHEDQDGITVIQTNALIFFGNSGGPAVNEFGRLIGIASYLNMGSRYGFYIHRDHILKFLPH